MKVQMPCLPRYDGPTDLIARTRSIAVGAAMPKCKVFIFAADCVKPLLSNNKSENDGAKTASKGADAGGTDKPATGRINDTTSNQKSSDDPAELQGGVESLRNVGPNLADATRTFGAHEGHDRTWNGDHKGGTLPHHSSGERFEEGTQKAACSIGKTNDWTRHPFGTSSGDDAAFGGELVQEHLRRPEHAGVQLSFWPSDVHNDGSAQSGQGQRVIAGRAGIGGASRPRNNGTLHSGGSLNPAATGQSHLTLPSMNLQGA
jgi:hypothetical protein